MKRLLIGSFGLVCYTVFFAVFLWLIAFLGNIPVAKTIDSGQEGPLGTSILINSLLVLLFAVQHTIMARKGFKQWLTRWVPKPMERSCFVLATSLVLVTIMSCWQPMKLVLWDLGSGWAAGMAYALFALGWLIVLGSTWLINHFDLFGLRQTLLTAAGRPYTHLEFKTPFIYRIVRHPLYVGMYLAFWCTPVMTLGHLLFAGGMSIYVLVGIQFEERDLIADHGEKYLEYRNRVPMLLPLPAKWLGKNPAPLQSGKQQAT